MALKFAIGNVVKVPVKFSSNDNGRAVKLGVTLICKRLPGDELREILDVPGKLIKDFMVEVTTGWEAQNFLVDEETGQPAEFSKENLAMLLSFPGLDGLSYVRYGEENGATAKN